MLGEKEIYKYLKIFEADTKPEEMKEKSKKEYIRRMRKLLENKLNWINLFIGISPLAVPLLRYSGSFLKWTNEAIQKMDQ